MFGFSVALIVTLMILVQSSINKGMLEYVNNKEIERLQPLVSELVNIYQQENNWDQMVDNNSRLRRLVANYLDDSFPPPHRGERFRRPPPPGGKPPRHNRPAGLPHFALLDTKGNHIAGGRLKPDTYIEIPIASDSSTIGFLTMTKRNQLTQGYEFDFIKQQKQFLYFIALLAVLFVAVVTIPLSRHLVIPLKKITTGIHKLTLGEYDQRIHLKRKDELGALSKDYNELAFTLAESEKSRKRWLANISHELRTPVSIIRGELEAMIDNIRPISKDNINSANDEVIHLQRLIEDLHLLATADVGGVRYQKSALNLAEFLKSESEKFTGYLSHAGIDLETNIETNFEANEITVQADKTRLSQLFENIINNVIKYAKASAVSMSLSTEQSATAIIMIEDNGVGVGEQHLAYLFDYLYRIDDARNRKDGGTGLGLSICRQIVDAHNGRITAMHSPLGGLAVKIELPLINHE